MRSDRERLLDIREALEQIDKYTGSGRAAFEQDELVQTWVVHHLQIIGEAARHVSSELQTQHPQIPWSKIIGMRHILVHHYFGIDVDVVWSVVERELPALRVSFDAILSRL